MSVFDRKELLTSLEAEVNEVLLVVKKLQQLDDATLNRQPTPEKWSVAQVIEHLNTYNRYYLAHMEKAIKASGSRKAKGELFNSGWLGDRFTKMMYSDVVSQRKVSNKMKAFKDHRPPVMLDARQVIAEFLSSEQELLALMGRSATLDIGHIKVPISISRWIRMSLGDTCRFLVAHQVRHFLQVRNTLTAIGAGL